MGLFSFLGNNKKQKSNRSVGLHITDHRIYFAELIRTLDGIQVGFYGSEMVPDEIIEDGFIRKKKGLAEILSRIASAYDLRDVHLGIPDAQSHTFHMTAGRQANDSDLQKAIEQEIIAHLKNKTEFPVNDLVIEYEIVDLRTSEADVCVTITQQSVMQQYLDVLGTAGIEPVSIDAGSNTMTQLYRHQSGSAQLVVNFGEDVSQIAIMSDGRMMNKKMFRVGADDLIKVISKFLSVEYPEAYKIRNRYGVMRSHRESDLLEELVTELLPLTEYIKASMIDWHTKAYKKKIERNPIERIVLHGDGAGIKGLEEFIEVATGMPVDMMNPWEGITLSSSHIPDIHKSESPFFAPALSLAMQGVE